MPSPGPSSSAAPEVVRQLAAGRDCVAVWHNEIGGVTWRIGSGAEREFVKWQPDHAEVDIGGEVRRLRWAARFVAVPRVLGHGRDGGADWLHTAGLPGENPTSVRWKADPLTASRAIGRGLRALHDTLPVGRCPFDRGVATQVVQRCRVSGRDPAVFARQLTAQLGPAPPVDRLVVCHGDACVPNTLLAADGTVTGHVDLGALGVADRWADLAIASWSTVWNYGPGFEVALLAAYGVEPDAARIAFYRTLWGDGPQGPGPQGPGPQGPGPQGPGPQGPGPQGTGAAAVTDR